MFNHNPFRLTGGAGGVDNIRQMVWGQPLRLGIRIIVRTGIAGRGIQQHGRQAAAQFLSL